MTLELIRTSSRLVARGRAIVLGGVVALVCSACASEEVASAPAGAMPPMMGASNDPAKKLASAPNGYPYASGAGLPTASAGAPTVTR